ncbi:hypothetical protein H9P43_006031 [Blastocladiella emersonii ATCC 22665]|nr:hypothetical protein H9P43_006031 [Blastocladiella emersonii ATCC 22665]
MKPDRAAGQLKVTTGPARPTTVAGTAPASPSATSALAAGTHHHQSTTSGPGHPHGRGRNRAPPAWFRGLSRLLHLGPAATSFLVIFTTVVATTAACNAWGIAIGQASPVLGATGNPTTNIGIAGRAAFLAVYWGLMGLICQKHFTTVFPALRLQRRQRAAKKAGSRRRSVASTLSSRGGGCGAWMRSVTWSLLMLAVSMAVTVARMALAVTTLLAPTALLMGPIDVVFERFTFGWVCIAMPVAYKVLVYQALPADYKSLAAPWSPLFILLAVTFFGWIFNSMRIAAGLFILLVGAVLAIVFTFLWINYHLRKNTMLRIRGHIDLAYFFFGGFFLLRAVSTVADMLPLYFRSLLVGRLGAVYQLVAPTLFGIIMASATFLIESAIPAVFPRHPDFWMSFSFRLAQEMLVTAISYLSLDTLESTAVYCAFTAVSIVVQDCGLIGDSLVAWRHRTWWPYTESPAPAPVTLPKCESDLPPSPVSCDTQAPMVTSSGGGRTRSEETLSIPRAYSSASGAPPPPSRPSTSSPELFSPVHETLVTQLAVQLERSQHNLAARAATLASFIVLYLMPPNPLARLWTQTRDRTSTLVIVAITATSLGVWLVVVLPVLLWKLAWARRQRVGHRMRTAASYGGAGGSRSSDSALASAAGSSSIAAEGAADAGIARTVSSATTKSSSVRPLTGGTVPRAPQPADTGPLVVDTPYAPLPLALWQSSLGSSIHPSLVWLLLVFTVCMIFGPLN